MDHPVAHELEMVLVGPQQAGQPVLRNPVQDLGLLQAAAAGRSSD
jgi:hypothetical protein